MSEKVVILGSGESGTGAALLAKAKGYEVFVSDYGTIKKHYKKELIDNNIAFEEGKHTEDEIVKASLVIKSPGIADHVQIVQKVKQHKIEIIDEIEWAFRFLKGKVIAITGTNGKTTTTLLTYHLLKTAGYNVALAGNVGQSLARQVASRQYDWYVLEVSSFQLDGMVSFRPDIGILLNITPDHLDRYGYKIENYIHSKFQMIKEMKASDSFIYYADDVMIAAHINTYEVAPNQIKISLKDHTTKAYYDGVKMSFNIHGKSFSIEQSDTTLKGIHNVINTLSAVSAALLTEISEQTIRNGLKTFINAPHRLERVTIIKGIEFVNDSKATNVDSVVYALGSYTNPLVWVAGGIDKGNDYERIKNQVKEKVKVLICLGKDNEKLKRAFSGIVKEIHETQSINEAVQIAYNMSTEGDVVLLSPACASFDLFKNYEDRGDQFRQAVLELVHKKQLINSN